MRRVVVVGSINMDVVTHTPRYPARGENVRGESVAFHPGGKGANQAVAAARLGAAAVLVGCVGDDLFGASVIEFVASCGVDVSLVRQVAVSTGTALIVVDDDGENTIVVVLGANGELTPDDVPRLRRGDVVVCQLETPRETVEAVLVAAREAGATSVLNAAPPRQYAGELAALADLVVVNELEQRMLGAGFRAPAQVVTLGDRGLVAYIGDREIVLPARDVNVIDTTGAGDCLCGAMAARLSAGDQTEDALTFATAAASICVTRAGAGPSMPTGAEVLKLLGR